jgi:hypothetical protein
VGRWGQPVRGGEGRGGGGMALPLRWRFGRRVEVGKGINGRKKGKAEEEWGFSDSFFFVFMVGVIFYFGSYLNGFPFQCPD